MTDAQSFDADVEPPAAPVEIEKVVADALAANDAPALARLVSALLASAEFVRRELCLDLERAAGRLAYARTLALGAAAKVDALEGEAAKRDPNVLEDAVRDAFGSVYYFPPFEEITRRAIEDAIEAVVNARTDEARGKIAKLEADGVELFEALEAAKEKIKLLGGDS